jgi:hypothetical protein
VAGDRDAHSDELFHAKKGSRVHIPPGVPHQVTAPEGVRMLMFYGPAGTEGMFADMHALTQEQLMNAELTAQLALKHDTMMIEKNQGRPGQGHDPGVGRGLTLELVAALIALAARQLPRRLSTTQI